MTLVDTYPAYDDELDASDERQQAAARLTPREAQVLQLLQRGLSGKQIGNHLGISEGTVKTHTFNIYDKLQVHRRFEAVLFARVPAVSAVQLRRVLNGEIPATDLLPNEKRMFFPAGTVLFRKGDVADALYCIVSGTIHIEEAGTDRGPGEVIGEMGLLSDDQRRIATVICTTDCTLAKTPAKEAMRLCLLDPLLSLYLAKLVRQRLAAAETAVAAQ